MHVDWSEQDTISQKHDPWQQQRCGLGSKNYRAKLVGFIDCRYQECVVRVPSCLLTVLNDGVSNAQLKIIYETDSK